MNPFEACLKKGKLRKFKIPKERIKLEIKAAYQDFQEAQDRLSKAKFKYATINAYYSLFHSARALLYWKGYRERSHYCLKVAITQLYIREKILELKFIDYFEEAIGLHGTYWHNNFGHVMSHGCINMRTSDACQLFEWTWPPISPDKNAVQPSAQYPGTQVIVHGQAPWD